MSSVGFAGGRMLLRGLEKRRHFARLVLGLTFVGGTLLRSGRAKHTDPGERRGDWAEGYDPSPKAVEGLARATFNLWLMKASPRLQWLLLSHKATHGITNSS